MHTPWPLLTLLFAGCFSSADTGTPDDTSGGEDTSNPEQLVLEPGFEEDLTHQGGCADVVLYAWKPDDTMALFFRTEGVAEAAHAAGEATTTSWTLPDAAVDLHLDAGEHLTHVTCNDVLEFETVIDATWTAAGGTITLVVTPTGEPTDWGEFPATGDLTLTDIVLRPDHGGEDVPLPSLVISSGIGWLPG